MGNCCKKRLNLVEKISKKYQNTEEKTSKSETKKNNEENVTEKKNKDILILTKNIKNNKAPESEEESLTKKDLINVNINFQRKEKFDEKKFKEYKNILSSYIKFRDKIESVCNKEKIYVVKNNDNELLIGLYNEVTKEREEEKVIEDDIINEKLIKFIKDKEEIRTKFKVMNFKMCEESIKADDKNEKKIDLLSHELCKLLQLKDMKGNEFSYINNEEKGQYRYLVFRNNKKIKIEIVNKIFSLIEIFDEIFKNNKYEDRYIKKKKKHILNSKNTVIGENININNNKGLEDIIINNEKGDNGYKDDISLEIDSKKENNNKKLKSSELLEKEVERIDVKIDEKKKEENEYKEKNSENKEKNKKFLEAKKENKEINIINEENNKNNEFILIGQENNEKENDLIQKAFKILFLFILQNGKIKNKETYYLCNKNIIYKIIKGIKNNNKEINEIKTLINNFLQKQSDIDDIQIIMEQFKQKNNIFFKDKYNFNNINEADLLLEKKEIININNDKMELFTDFIFLKSEIYELLLKFFNLEEKEDINKIFRKIELLKNNDKFIIINIYEESNIYICEPESKDEIKVFNIFFGLFYNSKEIYLKEYISLEKNNFDIYSYLQEKKLNINTYTQNLLDEENEEIGYFINLKQPKDKKEEKNEEKEENIPLKPIGLMNINSNSYSNSFLQCLFHIPELNNFFILDKNFSNLKEEVFINEDPIILNNIEIVNNSLSFKYLEVLYHLYHKKQNNKYIEYYSPKNLLEYIQNKDPKQFVKNRENNPKRFCNYFMENLREELNEKENIKNLELENASNLFNSMIQNEENLFQKYLADFKFKNNSIIDKIFIGIKLSSINCEQCNELEQIFNDFYFLNFSLEKTEENMENKSKKIDFNECFKYYFNSHKANQNCIKCGNNNNTFISQKIYLSPIIIVLILEDIKTKGNLFKIDMEININEYSNEKNEGYKLIGIITYFKQHGSNESYIAYCYSNEYNKWYCFVDEYVYEVNDIIKNIEETKRLPYILFYKGNTLYKN